MGPTWVVLRSLIPPTPISFGHPRALIAAFHFCLRNVGGPFLLLVACSLCLSAPILVADAPYSKAGGENGVLEGERLVVQPDSLLLTGEDPEHGVLVSLVGPNGVRRDVTALASFRSATPDVAMVGGRRAQISARGDGRTKVEVTYDGKRVFLPVECRNMGERPEPSFLQDVVPILTKSGCNMGGCHGKLAGQNGFRLSLRGFAPEWDHEWLTREVQGRRVNVAFPEDSLILQKANGALVHEGGMRFKPGSRFEETLLRWITARAPGPTPSEPDAERLEVLPGGQLLRPGESQQLLVRAHYAGGRTRDVTWLALFFSNDEALLKVRPDGFVRALRHGEGSVRVHFQGQVEVVRFSIPFSADVSGADFSSASNALDGPVFAKMRDLCLPPSPACDDQTFVRRTFLDAIGTLPSPSEAAAFLADKRPDKRARLVDSLLERSEWVDYWTLQLADLLQNRKERDHDVRGSKGVRAFHAWLRSKVAVNTPWNEIARSVLLASGDTQAHPEVGYYLTVIGEKQRTEESELPDSVAQSFLGTRIGCARCHNHPLEKYTQDDFYHFAAYFSKMTLRRGASPRVDSQLLTLPREQDEQQKRAGEARERLMIAELEAVAIGEEAGGDEAQKRLKDRQKEVLDADKKLAEMRVKPPGVNQPRTGKMMAPQPLDRTVWEFAEGRDPREQFVNWALASEQFSGAMVNRLWKHFFNTGLVEPVDDLRASNPPSNGAVWTVLNREFVEHGFDLKHVMRLILNSRVYQLSSETLPGNEADTRFYTHYYARRLPAEVLMDAIAAATDVPAKFDGYPVGLRAAQLAEPGVTSYFLTLFGRSERVTACACERQGEVTLPQLLHLHNSEDLLKQINDPAGRLAGLLRNAGQEGDAEGGRVAESIFMAAMSRPPTPREKAALARSLAGAQRDAVFADLFWAVLNSKEFAFNH